jgi:hypothetical protein
MRRNAVSRSPFPLGFQLTVETAQQALPYIRIRELCLSCLPVCRHCTCSFTLLLSSISTFHLLFCNIIIAPTASRTTTTSILTMEDVNRTSPPAAVDVACDLPRDYPSKTASMSLRHIRNKLRRGSSGASWLKWHWLDILTMVRRT